LKSAWRKASAHESREPRLAFWQGLTIALLFIGYAGYYLCRSDFSVSLPLIIDELAAHGMTPAQAKIRLGAVTSIRRAGLCDRQVLSGRHRRFPGRQAEFPDRHGRVDSVYAAVFAGGGLPIFTLAWIGNRLVQSTGWAGMVKITSRWFSYSSYGAVMGAISLSYLFGDAAARQFMGFLIGHGFGWRAVFQVAAGTLFVIFIANLLLLKGIARADRPRGAHRESAEPVRRGRQRSEAIRPARLARAAVPQPGILDRVRAVAGNHAGARDFQYLDAHLLQPGGGLQ
jgi:hypothetical protein